MIAHRRSRDIGNRVATLAHIYGSFKDQRCCTADRDVADAKDSVGCSVSTLRGGSIVGSRCQSCWKEVIQENSCCIVTAIVSDRDLEGDYVAFIRCRITTEQCLDGDQIRCWKQQWCGVVASTCVTVCTDVVSVRICAAIRKISHDDWVARSVQDRVAIWINRITGDRNLVVQERWCTRSVWIDLNSKPYHERVTSGQKRWLALVDDLNIGLQIEIRHNGA